MFSILQDKCFSSWNVNIYHQVFSNTRKIKDITFIENIQPRLSNIISVNSRTNALNQNIILWDNSVWKTCLTPLRMRAAAACHVVQHTLKHYSVVTSVSAAAQDLSFLFRSLWLLSILQAEASTPNITDCWMERA